MKMNRTISNVLNSDKQTKFFIFTLAIYMLAMVWTTVQSYARLEYSRSDNLKPIIIQAEADDSKK